MFSSHFRFFQPHVTNLYASVFLLYHHYENRALKALYVDLIIANYYSPIGYHKLVNPESVVTCKLRESVQWPMAVPFGRIRQKSPEKTCLQLLTGVELALAVEFLLRRFEQMIRPSLVTTNKIEPLSHDPALKERNLLNTYATTLDELRPFTSTAKAIFLETFMPGTIPFEACAPGCICTSVPFDSVVYRITNIVSSCVK